MIFVKGSFAHYGIVLLMARYGKRCRNLCQARALVPKRSAAKDTSHGCRAD